MRSVICLLLLLTTLAPGLAVGTGSRGPGGGAWFLDAWRRSRP